MVPKMVEGNFRIEVIEDEKIIYEYEDKNKILIWVHEYFANAVYGMTPPDIDNFRIHAFALGTNGEYPLNGGTKPIENDRKRLYSEDNFWNMIHYPPEESYVYQVTFDKPEVPSEHLVTKISEGTTWPHLYGNPIEYMGTPKNYEDEIEAGVTIERSFDNGILTNEIYLGKLAGNGHPMWENPVKFSEAAFYMTDGATENGDKLGTMFSMKTFPGMPKTEHCVIKIQWTFNFNI